MDIKIATNPNGLGEAVCARLERLVRSVLNSGVFRIPLVIVSLEDLNACRGQWGWECRIYARFLPAGAKAVVGTGDDATAALRGAAKLLARSLRAEDGWYRTISQPAGIR
jgi:hypothetical protein